MQQRVRFARATTVVCGLAIMVSLIPREGWAVLALGLAMLLIVVVGARHLDRRRRPELWVFASTVLTIQLALAGAVVLTGGPRTALSCLLAAPVLMVGARFSRRGLLVGAPTSIVLVLAVTIGSDPAYAWRHPESVAIPLSMVIITAAYLGPLVASDVRHRVDSALDPLTGALNRRGLESRLAEVVEQAALSAQPVSVVAADVDHLKEINDEHGHEVGDRALRDIAETLRQSLRTFELLYRVGGDEFLLLLPGASSDQANAIAENLRRAVSRSRPGGFALTCSFGISTASTSADAATLTYHADVALYRAKRNGRNRTELERPVAAPGASVSSQPAPAAAQL